MEKSESSPSKKDPKQRMNEINSAMSSLFSETSEIPKSGDAKRFFDKKLNSNYEMETQFKKDSWVWIAGLNGAKELNGMLGQIVKYSEERQRYYHGVYLCLIFEMSIWEFITNSKKKSILKQTRFFVEFKLDFCRLHRQ